MYLQNLDIVNFKNYTDAQLTFSEGINCFTGLNGAGKTNLFDAISYLCVCKSFINPIDSQNIKQEADFFVVQGTFSNNETSEAIFCGLKRNNKKQFKRNGKEYERLADHVGLFPLVIISPEDSSIVLGGSDERRRLIDTTLAQTNAGYLDNLIAYTKVLTQRNNVLKQFSLQRHWDTDLMAVYDEQLVTYGTPIYQTRKEFIAIYADLFTKHYQAICGNATEVASLHYKTNVEGDVDFAKLLLASTDKDRVTQFTNIGIHKDDLVFELNGMPMKKFGSQGQQKSFLMALKLAQFDYLYTTKGVKPLVLLDDLFDKLDEQRVAKILQMLSNGTFGQVFITHTDAKALHTLLQTTGAQHKIYTVNAGTISLYEE